MAIHTWGRSPLIIDPHLLLSSPFQAVLGEMLLNLPEYGFFIFATIAWNLWKGRNSFYFENCIKDPGDIIKQSLKQAEEFYKAAENIRKPRPSRQAKAIWKPPDHGLLKINSDAAVFADGSVGLGFVIRDSGGRVKLAGSKRCLAAAENSTLIEALALRFGVQSANSNGLLLSILEADSSNLIMTLQGNWQADTHTLSITEDILDLLRGHNNHRFSFVRRTANRVAHTVSH